MAGMEFEYDEEGGTFYFFLMSFMALVLIPTTYYLWGSGEVKGYILHLEIYTFPAFFLKTDCTISKIR